MCCDETAESHGRTNVHLFAGQKEQEEEEQRHAAVAAVVRLCYSVGSGEAQRLCLAVICMHRDEELAQASSVIGVSCMQR